MDEKEIWRGLYEAAVRFRDLAPWQWMADSDIFGVADPASGTVGYCTVMGQLGEFFALGVYPGPAGYAVFRDVQEGRLGVGNPDMIFHQNSLMASFENRDELTDRDRQLIKEAGIKPRGRNAWPLIRAFEPGYYPWHPTAEQAAFLRVALEQAAQVAERVREDPGHLQPAESGRVLVRVSERRGETLRWRDEVQPLPARPEKPAFAMPRMDEARLKELAGRVKRLPQTWEMDVFYAPMPIREGQERPWYPRMMMLIDRASGMLLDANIVTSGDWIRELGGRLPALIDKAGIAPERIAVMREEALALVAQAAEALGIRVDVEWHLPALEEARASMEAFFDR